MTAAAVGDRLDELLAEHQTWLAAERGLRPNTLAAYGRDLRSYASFLRRKHADDPARIGEQLIERYVAELRDA